VGANWLNKLGVLIFVVGLGMLVSFSISRLGPAGRVAIGFVLSLAMLGGGVVLARRDRYANYGYGLMAGGWGGIYFTTYAMHAIDAARIVESAATGTALLALVAAAMLAHTMRYRSQTITALALIVVYVTLAATPLTAFALLAAVPLATVVLVIAARRRWPAVSALGIGATYLLFTLRGFGVAGSPLDAGSYVPYLLLALYWLTFEAADVIGRLRRQAEDASAVPLFGLNAIGLVGASVLGLPAASSDSLAAYLAFIALGYLGSAMLRLRLAPARGAEAPDVTRFTTFHAAMAMATALLFWSTGVRFEGIRQALIWLLTAEMVAVTGLTLRDRPLRLVGAGALALAVMQACAMAVFETGNRVDWLAGVRETTPVILLAAATLVLNREWLRRRDLAPALPERAMTWTAAAIVALVIAQESAAVRTGLLLVLAGGFWLEAGLRHAREYRYQGYVLGLLGATHAYGTFADVPGAITAIDTWLGLGGAILILLAGAGRVWTATETLSAGERQGATGTAVSVAALLLAVLEWRVVPADWLTLAWSTTGVAAVAAGLTRSVAFLRWVGYVFLGLASSIAFGQTVLPGDLGPATLVAIGTSIALLFAAALAGRRALGDAPVSVESLVLVALMVLGTGLITVLIAEELRPSMITLAWGLAGLLLLATGFPSGERPLRLCGLALLALCILKLFVYDMRELDALPRILSFVVLGLVLLSVSWVYTRRKV